MIEVMMMMIDYHGDYDDDEDGHVINKTSMQAAIIIDHQHHSQCIISSYHVEGSDSRGHKES
jgi:hypothetical protein